MKRDILRQASFVGRHVFKVHPRGTLPFLSAAKKRSLLRTRHVFSVRSAVSRNASRERCRRGRRHVCSRVHTRARPSRACACRATRPLHVQPLQGLPDRFPKQLRTERGARLCSPRAALVAVACTHMEASAHPAPAQGIKPLRAPPHICCGFLCFFSLIAILGKSGSIYVPWSVYGHRQM